MALFMQKNKSCVLYRWEDMLSTFVRRNILRVPNQCSFVFKPEPRDLIRMGRDLSHDELRLPC